MFSPSSTGLVRVKAQCVRLRPPDHSSSPSPTADAQELRVDFSGEVFDANFRLNTPRMTRITRMFSCRGSHVGCDRQSTIKHQTSNPPTDGFAVANIKHSFRGFTLLELLIVITIIVILMVLIVPAFTNIKSGTDVTSAAYTIKGVLDTARTYAKANNTYTWVGFFEENVASTTPGTQGVGRIVMSIVASKDGTNVASSGQMVSANLSQVGKLTKIDNVHIGTNFPTGSGAFPGSTFDTRPNVASTYCLGDMANSTTTFTYPLGGTTQYTFRKWVQFGSDGAARINNPTSALQTAAEIGLEQTHGNVTPVPTPVNLVAIQFTGVGGNVTIYRK
jgi:prepilin-type N-terminal cleavage/methylation domain-containing protein